MKSREIEMYVEDYPTGRRMLSRAVIDTIRIAQETYSTIRLLDNELVVYLPQSEFEDEVTRLREQLRSEQVLIDQLKDEIKELNSKVHNLECAM